MGDIRIPPVVQLLSVLLAAGAVLAGLKSQQHEIRRYLRVRSM